MVMEWLYVWIRSNSLGDDTSGYGQIAYVAIKAICLDTFLIRIQFKFAQVTTEMNELAVG